jgi:F0F1-type ATP synthase membrane subunit b/b'
MLDSDTFRIGEFWRCCCLFFLGLEASAIQLVPDATLLLHFFLIIGMVVILNATLLKPINRVLAMREQQTQGRLEEAESILANAHERIRTYEQTLREVRAEGYLQLERQREELATRREQKVKESKDEVAAWASGEGVKLENEAARARSTLHRDAEKAAEMIARQILRREVLNKHLPNS